MSKQSNQVQLAIDDVAIIKQTLERSKAHLGMLSALFFWIGGIQIVTYIIKGFGLFYFLTNNNMIGITWLQIIGYITLAAIFTVYLKKRNIIKNTKNITSIQLFNLWGIVLFVIPLLKLLLVPVYVLTIHDNQLGVFAFSFSDTITYGATIMGILVTGIVVRKKALTIGSAIFLAGYPLLFFCGETINGIDMNITSIYGFFANANASANVILMLLYVALGVYFKLQSDGDISGTE